ncbi:hypothetical protein ROT00_00340 [Agromyces mediolanus]|uniref:hypothetical protein n=1 Tax=Agromyces mediolanus TaxID=41986 RepID=UPI0038372250
MIERVVDEVQGSGIDPRGYRERRPSVAWSPVMHNPYASLILVAAFSWVGVFVVDREVAGDVGSWVWACFMWLGSLLILALTVWRIPKWHRARAAVRRHIAAHGGEMPDDLKWYR